MTDTFVTDASGKQTILKDPAATLDYTFNWTPYLAAMLDDGLPAAPDVISSALCTISSNAEGTDASVVQTAIEGAYVTAWVAGGNEGETLKLTCQITTTGGRIELRSVYLKIKAR